MRSVDYLKRKAVFVENVGRVEDVEEEKACKQVFRFKVALFSPTRPLLPCLPFFL